MMSRESDVFLLEQAFNQSAVPVSPAKTAELLDAVFTELNTSLSQWELIHRPERLKQLLSQLQEQRIDDSPILAVKALMYALYAQPHMASKAAYQFLNAKAEGHLSVEATRVEWAAYLAVAHIHSMAGESQVALHFLNAPSLKVPPSYGHLVMHAHNLRVLATEQRSKQDKSFKHNVAKSWVGVQQWPMLVQQWNLSTTIKQVNIINQLLNLMILEVMQSPHKQLLNMCDTLLNQVHLSSVVVHAAQLELNHLEWQGALKRLKRSIRRLPSQPLLWLELSHVYNVISASEKSIHALEKAVTLMPSLTVAQMELGLAYAEKGHLIPAMEHYLMAYLHADTSSTKRKISYLMTNALEQKELGAELDTQALNWRDLCAQVALVLKLEQETKPTAATLSHMAKLANSLNQHSLAVMLCEKALVSKGGQNPQCLVNLAFSLWQARDIQRSIFCYREALVQDPDNAVAHNNLGTIYFDELNDTVKAQKHFELALSQNVNYAMAHFNMGRVFSSQSLYKDAAHSFACAKATNVITQELDNEEINHYMHQLFDKM